MAKKITGLPAAAAADLTQLFETVTNPSTTPTSENLSLQQVKNLFDTFYQGTLTLPLSVANGGTGLSTFGGTNRILYTSATDTLTSLTNQISSAVVTNASGTIGWADGGSGHLGHVLKSDGSTLSFGLVQLNSSIGQGVTGRLDANNGGTGQTTVTTGDLLYGSSTNTWSKLAGVATGNALISGGVTTAPSWGKIGLTTHVSGTLGVGNGGTGVTSFGGTNTILYTTATDAISSITTANSSVLVTNGSGVPSWSRIVDCDVVKMPVTNGAGTAGVIFFGGNRVMHNYTDPAAFNNFFVGTNAGNLSNTGSFNIGLGASALFGLTSGSYNMAIGSSSCISLTTGDQNVGVGVSTLQSVTTGNRNVGIGYGALSAGSFDDNTAIGWFSQDGVTTGNQNTTLGRSSGHAITTGSNNTYIGYRAGDTDGTTATPNNLTNSSAIGNLSQVTASNCLVLGGLNSNQVNVGIGKSAPTARLHILAGTATAGTAPLKLSSGTNLTTGETGAMEYDGTNLFFTRTGTTRESIFTGVSGAAAPATNAIGTIVDYYGSSATRVLTTPNSWASVVIGGTTYKIPLYT